MVKKKTTKEIRAIDRIIKFQIDDGIESLTIKGKEALADLEIDNKNNVTLYLNADKDKINELHSLVPFINLAIKEEGVDPDKQQPVTLSQDLTQFAIEIADNSKELATLIKTQSSIVLDLDGLVQKLLEIAGKLAELERKNQEQDERMTTIEAKDLEQDGRLTTIEEKNEIQDERLDEIDVTQEAHASKLHSLEEKDLEQDGRLTTIEEKDLEQDGRLTALENSGTDYQTEIITTVAPYYEEPYKAMGVHGTFGTTHHLRTNIGNYTIIDGIVFITIHRYVGETYDGQATVVGMFDEGRVSESGLIQEHIIEMKTILSGNVKIHCELLNNGTQQHFILYNIPNDTNEKYKISVHGFNFVPKQVLVPNTPMSD